MKRKIFKSLFILSAVSIVITSLAISLIIYNEFYKEMKEEVKQEAEYIAQAVNLKGNAYLMAIDSITKDRITWIDDQGNVLYDSQGNIENMDNHVNRPEVAKALTVGKGEISRMSDTIGEQTFYYAIKLNDGSVIRVANTTENVYAAVAGCISFMLLSSFVMLIITIFVAKKQTKAIVAPINMLNLEEPMSNEVYDEFAPLLRKLEQQKVTIDKAFSLLKTERSEFASITENMNEGLIILNVDGEMLFVNKKAIAIFSKVKEESIGGHYLTLNRSVEFREAIEEALEGKPSEKRLWQNGRCYQLMANPTYETSKDNNRNDMGNNMQGAVLLALDITEKEEADKLRREFSSNVSHELRTPLTSISGYAEIIQQGIAKPENIPDFAGKIYSEAKRLILLIEDIMKLSELDEGNIELPYEEIDLQEISREVVDRLEKKAAALKVTLTFIGTEEPVVAKGVKSMLDEMLFNLCDNAIKYNREGGSVTVTAKTVEGKASLQVTDTGIGIPIEHQERIFERFYRVDKSHSKETDGTGLGLSIVKHVVKYHNAEMTLESQEGKGTTISVYL